MAEVVRRSWGGGSAGSGEAHRHQAPLTVWSPLGERTGGGYDLEVNHRLPGANRLISWNLFGSPQGNRSVPPLSADEAAGLIRRLQAEGAQPIGNQVQALLYNTVEPVRHSRAAKIITEIRRITAKPKPTKAVAAAVQKMAAYRAPAGGINIRGQYYQGGKLIPDLKKWGR